MNARAAISLLSRCNASVTSLPYHHCPTTKPECNERVTKGVTSGRAGEARRAARERSQQEANSMAATEIRGSGRPSRTASPGRRGGARGGLPRRLGQVIVTALVAAMVLPLPYALLSQVAGDRSPYQTDAANAQSIPAPIPNCSPLGGVVPAGQANPSDEPEPMGPIWCFPLVNSPTTRVSGANDWVDSFETNVSMGHLNDHEMGYRNFSVNSEQRI